MTKESLDGWIPVIVGTSCLIGGSIIGYFVIPELVKVFGPKPQPQTNPIPQPEPEKQPEPRMRPKFVHSSAHLGEPSPFESAGRLRVIPPDQRLTYGHDGTGGIVQIKRQKPRWRVIE